MERVAIVGAAGYTGAEAMRWVGGHPHLELVRATSAADAGRRVASLYPALEPLAGDLEFVSPDPADIIGCADVAVLAVPHTAALGLVPALHEAGLIVIDLSADFRLQDPSVYEEWYGAAHTAPALLGQAVYGLPELDRSRLSGARLVAGPGCYPTATILAALPVVRAGLWDGRPLVVDAKSGVTGAGRSASAATHFVTVNEALAPYKTGTHRHTPEIEQALASVAGVPVGVVFSPHLVPMSRGLLATVYLGLTQGADASAVSEAFTDAYADEPFVRLCGEGMLPSTAQVRGSALAAVGFHVDERTGTLVAACAIDNLGKGAAAQGIQCLNAVLGLPETEGLLTVGAVV